MARLRVGDIEIDGANISIGGVPQVPVTPTAPAAGRPALPAAAADAAVETSTTVASQHGATVAITHSRPVALARRDVPAAEREGLASLPVSERVLVGGGVALLAGGAVLFALTALSLALVMIFTGAGAIALAALKRGAVGRQERLRAQAADRELSESADAVRPLLGESKPEQTVEWIAARSKLPEATVVRALAWLRDRGEVTEELNTETGEWYYAATPALPGASLPLDERLALIDGSERKR